MTLNPDSVASRRRLVDLSGRRFGSVEVLAHAGVASHGNSLWEVRCDCGRVWIAHRPNLKRRKSCGQAGCPYLVNRTHGYARPGQRTSEYRAWDSAKDRCTNPRGRDFSNYGGRGISVCDRWLESFENFLADVGPRPSPNHSIDRINNDGDYEPGNVRWATRSEQNRNRRPRPKRAEKVSD